jgi:TPR repeat protein
MKTESCVTSPSCNDELCKEFKEAYDLMEAGRYSECKPILESLSERGCHYATYNLGWMYKSGNGVQKDLAKALELYHKASILGNADAMYNIAESYVTGEGNKQDFVKSFEILLRGATLGHTLSEYQLGMAYFHGKGVKVNFTKAFEFFMKAAEKKFFEA